MVWRLGLDWLARKKMNGIYISRIYWFQDEKKLLSFPFGLFGHIFFFFVTGTCFLLSCKTCKNKSNKQIIKTNWTVMIGWGWNSVCHLNSKFPVWFDGPDIHKQHRCNHFCPICKCCFMYSGIFFSLSPKRKKNQRSKSKLLVCTYIYEKKTNITWDHLYRSETTNWWSISSHRLTKSSK